MNPTRIRLVLALVFVLCTKASYGGSFSIHTFTTESGTGLDSRLSYTHLVDTTIEEMTPDKLATINGVHFTQGLERCGTNYTVSGQAGGTYNAYDVNTGIYKLLYDYLFDDESPTLLINLTGLTPGTAYDLRLYNGGIYPYIHKKYKVEVTNGGMTDSLIDYDQLAYGMHYLQYEYTAESSALAISITRTENANATEIKYMLAGFTNSVVPAAVPEPSCLMCGIVIMTIMGRKR